MNKIKYQMRIKQVVQNTIYEQSPLDQVEYKSLMGF